MWRGLWREEGAPGSPGRTGSNRRGRRFDDCHSSRLDCLKFLECILGASALGKEFLNHSGGGLASLIELGSGSIGLERVNAFVESLQTAVLVIHTALHLAVEAIGGPPIVIQEALVFVKTLRELLVSAVKRLLQFFHLAAEIVITIH